MTKRRAEAPPRDQWGTEGHEAHFADIEDQTGRPIQEWLDAAGVELDGASDKDVAEWLKAQHGLPDAHANAIVGYANAPMWR